jgi:DNA polymerase III epsilon subunit family exonuclease
VRQLNLNDEGRDLASVRFAVVDVETTGQASATDAITEIAVVVAEGGVVRAQLQSLVCTGVTIPPAIVALTGITQDMVAHAPSPGLVLNRVAQLVDGAVLVGHNVRFDRAFLEAAAQREGVELPFAEVLDTLVLSRALLDGEVTNHRLGTLARTLGLPTPTHRAMADARATLALLYRLIERAGTLGATTLEDLLAIRRVPQRGTAPLARQASRLPHRPGIYYFRDAREVLYVGRATDLQARVCSYFTSDARRGVRRLLARATTVACCPIDCEVVRAVTERAEIQRLRPVFNTEGVRLGRARWHTTPLGRRIGPWPERIPPPPRELLARLDGPAHDVAMAVRAILDDLSNEMDARACMGDYEGAAALRDLAALLGTRVPVSLLLEACRDRTLGPLVHAACADPHELCGRAGLLALGPSDERRVAERALVLLRAIADDDGLDDDGLLGDLAACLYAARRFQRRSAPSPRPSERLASSPRIDG